MISVNVPDFMLEGRFWISTATYAVVMVMSMAARLYVPRGIFTSLLLWGAFWIGIFHGVRLERLWE